MGRTTGVEPKVGLEPQLAAADPAFVRSVSAVNSTDETVASTGLTFVAWFLLGEASPPVHEQIVLANRLMSLLAVLVAAGLALYVLSWVARIEQVSEKLHGAERLMSTARQLVRFGAWSFDVRSQQLHWTPEVFDIHEVSTDREPSLDEATRARRRKLHWKRASEDSRKSPTRCRSESGARRPMAAWTIRIAMSPS